MVRAGRSGGSGSVDEDAVVNGLADNVELGRGGGEGLLPGGSGGRDDGAVARSLGCFERAAALAKSHKEVRVEPDRASCYMA